MYRNLSFTQSMLSYLCQYLILVYRIKADKIEFNHQIQAYLRSNMKIKTIVKLKNPIKGSGFSKQCKISKVYLSLNASLALLNGLIKYCRTVFSPVRISVVATIPGVMAKALPALL